MIDFLIAGAITFFGMFVIAPVFFGLCRMLGFYTIEQERQARVYVLFGKVVLVILVIAFATGDRGLSHTAGERDAPLTVDVRMIVDRHISPLFQAAVEATEAAVVNALLARRDDGRPGWHHRACPRPRPAARRDGPLRSRPASTRGLTSPSSNRSTPSRELLAAEPRGLAPTRASRRARRRPATSPVSPNPSSRCGRMLGRNMRWIVPTTVSPQSQRSAAVKVLPVFGPAGLDGLVLDVAVAVGERDEGDQRGDDEGAVARKFSNMGFGLIATKGTARILKEHGVDAQVVHKLSEGRPNVLDHIKNGKIQLVINTSLGKKTSSDADKIRRATLVYGVTYTTTISGACAMAEAVEALQRGDWGVKTIQEYHAESR